MKFFKIGEISKLYKISSDILRYYEREGLLVPEKRGGNGYRYYSNKQIWKLGTIRALRNLGVGLEEIKEYLKERNLKATNDLIEFQLDVVDKKIEDLLKIKRNLEEKKRYLYETHKVLTEEIQVRWIPKRMCYRSYKSVFTDWEIDLELKKLKYLESKSEGEYFASNRVGAIVDKNGFQEDLYNLYEGTTLIDKEGDYEIKEGNYIVYTYRGPYERIGNHYKIIKDYMKEKHLKVDGEIIEIFKIDICETEDEREFLTEIQIPIKK